MPPKFGARQSQDGMRADKKIAYAVCGMVTRTASFV